MRFLRIPFWLSLGVVVGFAIPYGFYLDKLVQTRFADLRVLLPSRVYARPLVFERTRPMSAEALLQELRASRYSEAEQAIAAGTFRRDGNRFEIATREFSSSLGLQAERRLVVELAGGRISRVRDADSGQAADSVMLDPARIATLYGASQEERRYLRIDETPALLVSTLLAVEDRKFHQHIGIDFLGIARAAWVNLVAGEVVQGASTLTQQLVRHLFLSRKQTISRKLNEAALALLIEARFDKQRILEAYLNEAYMGQQGAQAIHGFAAGAEFYFGRDLNALSIGEMASLIAIVKGPSEFNPRRYQDRVQARRDVVLKVMANSQLISEIDRAVASKASLQISDKGGVPKNRYPAFLELVREQIRANFPESKLRSEGLIVMTTLAPSTQAFAEAAVKSRLAALGKAGAEIEAALVVTDTQTGNIEAMIGGRNPDAPGFNRAIQIQRPIGSLVKPFVYLVALAQPDRWSLMSVLSDSALQVQLSRGKTWRPENIDGIEHGEVLLIDALARSFNLATVRLGMEVGVSKVERLLEALTPGADISPHPSLLLGATGLAPIQVTQAYQYLAADGKPMVIRSVDAVLDSNGLALARYVTAPSAGDLVAAARLVNFALQEATRTGTGAALIGLGLGHLNAAGKTGTSNDQRDSWFAGFSGRHLAVVWMGRDDNKKTSLFGSTGGLRVWAELFAKLPTEPLKLQLDQDPRMVWIDPRNEKLTDAQCPNARQVPYIVGYAPTEIERCPWARFNDWFGISR